MGATTYFDIGSTTYFCASLWLEWGFVGKREGKKRLRFGLRGSFLGFVKSLLGSARSLLDFDQ